MVTCQGDEHTRTKKTPYELVFGQESRSGFVLMKELYDQGIRDEEDIPDNVQTDENVREELGESVMLSDDNSDSSAREIIVPESESAPTPRCHV
ncbi:6669_t:CDS:2 [Paraglomus occultum]|uniref:6669_t:CDS:1 n=1 Tax=Paraglomus occultum TaxID=144539 RepID=A0A9N9B2J4_9GLOM|nr:6669_t:CDS:2 [Paraglomus occultum]